MIYVSKCMKFISIVLYGVAVISSPIEYTQASFLDDQIAMSCFTMLVKAGVSSIKFSFFILLHNPLANKCSNQIKAQE